MSGLARKLYGKKYDVEFMHADGTTSKAPSTFTPHGGGPRKIPPKSPNPSGPMTIIFKKPKEIEWWEIINGIQFVGRSECCHEIDVSILPRQITDWVRNNGGGRPYGHAPFNVECKYKGSKGSLDEMRECVARHYDQTILHSHPPPSRNTHHARLYASKGIPPYFGTAAATFMTENHRTFSAIVRKSSFSGWGKVSNLTKIADYYRIRPYANADVASTELDDFFTEAADWIDANL